jgi:dihydroflavonol-4-reductase
MNILVTGANGFIGSNLVKRLVAEGHSVKAMVLKGTSAASLQNVPCEIVYADVTQPETLVASDIELVYHLAALPSLAWSNKVYEVNYAGTKNILNEAVRSKVKRIVFMSSLVVHGFRHFEEANEEAAVKQPGLFTHPYIRSKIDAEKFLKDYAAQIETVVIRPGFFIFGPGDMLTSKQLLDRITQGKFLGYMDGGKHKLGYVFIDNLVHGLICAGTHTNAANNTYVIADYEPPHTSLHELFGMMAVAAGKNIQPISIPSLPVKPIGFASDVFHRLFLRNTNPLLSTYTINTSTHHLHFSSAKAQQQIGYQQLVSLQKGIEKTVEWYKTNFS